MPPYEKPAAKSLATIVISTLASLGIVVGPDLLGGVGDGAGKNWSVPTAGSQDHPCFGCIKQLNVSLAYC